MELNKLTEYTARKSKRATDIFSQPPQTLHVVEPIEQTKPKPIKPLPVEKPKKKKKCPVLLFLFLGVLVGVFIVYAISFTPVNLFYTSGQCQDIVNEVSRAYYSQGAFYVMNYTRETGNLPFIENGTLQETSIASQCAQLNLGDNK